MTLHKQGRCIILDLDGVVFDCTHRLPLVHGKDRDYDEFYRLIPKDEPIEDVIQMVKAMSLKAEIVCVTGRSEVAREDTEHQLSHYLGPKNINWCALYMRAEGDHRPAAIVKEDILHELYAHHWEPFLAIEDTPECVAMYRKHGIKTFDVGREKHEDAKPAWSIPEFMEVPLVLMVGPVGAGKTTYLNRLCDKGHIDRACIISADRVRDEIYGDWRTSVPWEEIDNRRVFKLVHEMAAVRLAGGLPVILDETHTVARNRRRSLALLPKGESAAYWILDRQLPDKMASRGWRSEELVRKFHVQFGQSVASALTGDGHANVIVKDLRET